MIHLLKPKSEFGRNVLTLMTGTTLAQAIPIAVMPILTRLYTPEDFGLLSLFLAVTMIPGSIANGRYELAIMLPEEDDDAINIAAVGLLIATALSLILLFVAVVFNRQIAGLLDNQEIGFWLYFSPLVVWMIGFFNVLNYLNTRKKLYKNVAIARVYKSFAMTFLQLCVGFIKAGATGLITGQIVSNVVANYKLTKSVIKNFDCNSVSKHEMIRLSKRYSDFPKYSVWAALLNKLSTHLLSILISIAHGVVTLGHYSISQRVLALPVSLIGRAIAQVYFQEATEEKKRTGKSISTFNSTTKKLLMIAIPAFALLFLFIEDMFVFVFGNDWEEAGRYARILVPFFAMQFVSSSVSQTTIVFEKLKASLVINTLLLFVVLLVFILFKEAEFEKFLIYLSGSLSALYFCFLLYYRFLAKGAVDNVE